LVYFAQSFAPVFPSTSLYCDGSLSLQIPPNFQAACVITCFVLRGISTPLAILLAFFRARLRCISACSHVYIEENCISNQGNKKENPIKFRASVVCKSNDVTTRKRISTPAVLPWLHMSPTVAIPVSFFDS